MGLTTSLFAIDTDKLKQKMGSGDSKLIQKLAPKKKPGKTQDLRVRVDLNGNLMIDGIPRTSEFFAAEIVRPKWARRELIVTYQPGKRPNRLSQGQELVNQIVQELAPKTKFTCLGSDWDWDGDGDEEISTEQAAIELVMGCCTRPDCGAEYGYGFKLLCDILGEHLGVIGGELEVAIAWDTRLLQLRSPVKLPATDDFPAISYLTAREVSAEFKRFSESNTSVAAEKWKVASRKQFLKMLGRASVMKRSMIAFCH